MLALVLAGYAVVRSPAPVSTHTPAELAELRSDVAKLRHSLEVTRSQQSAPNSSTALAEAERRIAQLEATVQQLQRTQPTAAVGPTAASGDPTPEPVAAIDLTPEELRQKVSVEKSADGTVTVSTADPALAQAALRNQ